MAGSNNIPKYAQINRENEFLEDKTRGVSWSQVNGTQITVDVPLTTSVMLQPFYLGPSTPNPLTGPTEDQIYAAFFGNNYLTTPGSTASFIVHNAQNVPETITFPGIGDVVIPRNSYYEVRFVVVGPGQVGLFNLFSSTLPTVGKGFVVDNNGVISLDTLQQGNNIAIANPDGTGGDPVFSFTPSGSSNGVTGPQYSFDFGNVATPAWSSQCQMLVSENFLWEKGSSMAPTSFAFVPSFSSPNILAGPAVSGTTYDTNGRTFQSYLGGWGAPTGNQKIQNRTFNNENILANLQSNLNSIHTVSQNAAGAGLNFNTWNVRAYQYTVPDVVGGTAFNYNAALAAAVPAYKELFSVDARGNVNGQVISGTSFVTVSSRKVKKDIRPSESEFGPGLEMLDSLKPVAYRYNHMDDESEKRMGLIAEEVLEAGDVDFLVSEESPVLAIKTDQLVYLLLSALKELKEEVRRISKKE